LGAARGQGTGTSPRLVWSERRAREGTCPGRRGSGRLGVPRERGQPPSCAGPGLGVREVGARSSLGSARAPPSKRGARHWDPLPTQAGAGSQPLPDFRVPVRWADAALARSLARREENGVGCTYLSEFGAHQDEEEEAEELPGRLHVSLPRPPSWHAGALVPALRGRGRAPGSAGPAPSAPGASALHGERVLRAVPAVPGRGAALRRPSSCAPPTPLTVGYI